MSVKLTNETLFFYGIPPAGFTIPQPYRLLADPQEYLRASDETRLFYVLVKDWKAVGLVPVGDKGLAEMTQRIDL